MVQFIHSGDLHLDSPLRGLFSEDTAPEVEDIQGASRSSLENLVTYAIDEKVPLVVIAGDLYDGDWKDFSTGLFFVKQMHKLAHHGIKVAIVRGNHDAANTMTRSLVMPDNVHIFSEVQPETWILEDLGIAVHGQSYSNRDVSDNLAISYPEPITGMFNIGLLHCLISGATGHQNYAPCTLHQLIAKNYDYWALGHVHQHKILHREPPVVYSGCSQGRHIKETGPKGCVLVDVNHGNPLLEFIHLDVVRWARLEVDITGSSSIKEITEKYRSQLRQLIPELDQRLACLRIILRGKSSLHGQLFTDPDTINANLQAAAGEVNDRIWIEKIVLQTQPEIDYEALTQSDTPQGELLRFLQEVSLSSDPVSLLRPDLTQLQSKISGTGLTADATPDMVENARDILMTLLDDVDC